jgi:hypothetical protein
MTQNGFQWVHQHTLRVFWEKKRGKRRIRWRGRSVWEEEKRRERRREEGGDEEGLDEREKEEGKEVDEKVD